MHNSGASKGFVISADAFIGLAFLFVIIITSFAFLSQVSTSAWNTSEAITTAQSTAAALEKSSALKSAVLSQSSEPLAPYLTTTPNAVCLEVSIFADANSVLPLVSTIKPGCSGAVATRVYTERTFVVNTPTDSNFFIARIGAWFRS